MPSPATRKLAFRVGQATDREHLHAFFNAALGAQPVYQEPGLVACQLVDGSLLEFYSPGACHPPYLFAQGPVVASFRVADLGRALAQAHTAGLQTVGRVEQVCAGLQHCYVAVADGVLVGLYQEGSPAPSSAPDWSWQL
ncbi:VOC family protein [Hymenobacter negativus]|uniref:VOC domain-containing protein n=1 Tax=Hymenobacter negativus TaxID=2795026 RepID=A0ABS3QN63_9BACT|nr:hypothetical protein [Hymenobacter negativus]MBO2012130.1 hypothetical protein [Hymenobacter negativus]